MADGGNGWVADGSSWRRQTVATSGGNRQWQMVVDGGNGQLTRSMEKEKIDAK